MSSRSGVPGRMQSLAPHAGVKLGTWKEPPWSGFDGCVTSPGKEGATPSSGRLWVFRLATAVLACGVVLGALEGGLRLAGVGWETGFLVRGEAGGRPVWNENPRFTWRFMPPELGRTPQPMSVPVEREPLLVVERELVPLTNVSVLKIDWPLLFFVI